MELNEIIEKRRTVRDYQDKKIPENILRNAIENAFKAPSFNHLREWDFIIINNLDFKMLLIDSENLEKEINIKALETLFENEELIKKEMYLDAIPKQKRMILDAPVVVVVVFKPKTQIEKATRIYDMNCLASVWCCIENFLLSLAEQDIFGVTYIPQNIEKLKNNYGIPGELEIAAVIPVGYKADNAKILKQKKIEISERIHFNKW